MAARGLRALAVLALLAAAAVPPSQALAGPPTMADDFEAGVGPAWASVVGGTATGSCGASSGLRALTFTTASATRSATTVPLPVEAGDALAFFWRASFSSTGCNDMESTDLVRVQYSNAGGAWTTLVELRPEPAVSHGLLVELPLPPQALGPATQFRWVQVTPGGIGDHWYLDDVLVGAGRLTVWRVSSTQTVPSVGLSTPPVDTPAACGADPCSEATQATTPALPLVPGNTCVPPQDAPTDPLTCTDEDGITLQPQATPAVPALCSVLGPACLGPLHRDPVVLVDSPQVQVKVVSTAIVVDYDGRLDDRTPFGPVSHTVDLEPFARPLTLTVCSQTCLLNVPPTASVKGVVTLDVVTGSTNHPVTVPIDL